jgi:hypothetical protein
MTSAGVSRIQLQEIKNLKESIANLAITPASNRYLVEEMYRLHNANAEIARLARQYVTNPRGPGYLDAGWDQVRDNYFVQHPLFSKEEITDPRLVAPPYLPLAIHADPGKEAQWLRNQRLKVGDPIKTDDPRKPIKYVTQKALDGGR